MYGCNIFRRKEMEKHIQKVVKEMEEVRATQTNFLANLSHEIRTPLNATISFSEMILGNNKIAEIQDYGKQILKESEHLLVLIDDLLDHVKIEAGKMQLAKQPVDLHDVVEQTINALQLTAMNKGIKRQLSYRRGDTAVYCGG